MDFTTSMTILVGENGSGKSTILEAIAAHCGFNPGGGNRSHLFNSKQEASPLAKHLRFSWLPKVTQGFFLRADSFMHFANYVDELAEDAGPSAYRPYGNKSLNKQSHGEAFISMFMNRIGEKGFYLLDEPEAALSPQRQLSLLKILSEICSTGDAQIIMATHSPMLITLPEARLLQINGANIEETNYRATSHFQIVRRFLSDPDKGFAELLDPD